MGGQGLPAALAADFGRSAYLVPGDLGSICLTSTAIRLRSTSTTPLATGKLLARDLDLVGFGGVQFDDGAAAQAHDLMDGHRGGPEDHHQVDADFIEGWHWGPGLTDKCKIACLEITTLWLANG